MKLSLATTGLATMCCLTTACGKEADLTPIDTSAVPNTTPSIVTTAPITTTAPIVTSTQQMSVDIPLTDDIIIDTTIGEDIVIVTDENASRDTFTTSDSLTEPTKTTTVGTTTTKEPTTVTTTTPKKTTVTTAKATTTTKKKTTTTTTTKKKTTTTTAKKQEITTTTSPVIKITQSDVDKLVNELQEYSDSLETDAKTDLEFQEFLIKKYGSLEAWYEHRANTLTPSNSSWGGTTRVSIYDKITDNRVPEYLKEEIDFWYENCPNCHVVIYAEYFPDGFVWEGEMYYDYPCYVFWCLR